ncbi:hypothetical protein [Streptosporangium sp. NPDC051022]|uniref:hypothetical protein n=1 Tax=Streptosporangium sp. NPDC051022 TaxID=3155752 RepID=UPI00343F397E
MTTITAHMRQEGDRAHVAIYAGDGDPVPLPCGVLTMAPSEAAELVARVRAGELSSTAITPKIAAHVLHHVGVTGGMEPEPFIQRLIDAIASADRTDQLRLAAVYPAYALAVHCTASADGIRRLQEVALAAPVPTAQDGGEHRG